MTVRNTATKSTSSPLGALRLEIRNDSAVIGPISLFAPAHRRLTLVGCFISLPEKGPFDAVLYKDFQSPSMGVSTLCHCSSRGRKDVEAKEVNGPTLL